ncbi:MAG TPA: GDP-mannose 4,6-dehydratase [Chloroflexota bacterium]
MKTVAVIGSNSFSGGDFVDLLLGQTDHRVAGISRSPEKSAVALRYRQREDLSRFCFHQLDLNHDMEALQELLGELRPAYVVNFAAQSEVAPSWAHPEQWFQTNAVAIAALGNYLKDQPWLERYVHISSPEVYGTCEGVVREDAPLNPSTPYAASKAAGDLMLFTLVKNFAFPLVMIRSTNVYGPGQQLFKIIPRTAIYLKLGNTLELHGGGAAVKSYIHIRDVSRGELAAMEGGRPGEIYHLSPRRGVAVKDVVRMLCEKSGKDFGTATRCVAERLGQDKAYVIDSGKAQRELGWQPEICLEEGLDQVVRWVDAYWTEIQHMPLDYEHQA